MEEWETDRGAETVMQIERAVKKRTATTFLGQINVTITQAPHRILFLPSFGGQLLFSSVVPL